MMRRKHKDCRLHHCGHLQQLANRTSRKHAIMFRDSLYCCPTSLLEKTSEDTLSANSRLKRNGRLL
eukprot:4966018-Alexandrium_andersonii.AAC.1